jgi:hypothetical protein
MKIDFEFVHPVHGKFRDALNLPDGHGLSEAEVKAMKQQRFDNWVAVVEAPPAEEPEADYIEVDGVKYVRA